MVSRTPGGSPGRRIFFSLKYALTIWLLGLSGFPLDAAVVGSLQTARAGHTGTTLADDEVLVIGGGDIGGGLVAAPEFFNPAKQSWTSFIKLPASLQLARGNHTANLINQTIKTVGYNEVVIAGGITSTGITSSTVIYYVNTGTWGTTNSLNVARRFHTATLLANGKILVTGGNGSGGAIASCELFNPVAGTWTLTGSLSTPRRYHTATLLANGKVLVTGGNNDATNSLATAEIYDPVSATWSPTGSMGVSRHYHTATRLANGSALVVGGSDANFNYVSGAELFDPAAGTWTAAGSLTVARASHTATLLADGRVLVTGGEIDNPYQFPSGELYDPNTGLWSLTAGTTFANYGYSANLLSSGLVLFAGGGIDGAISLPVPAVADAEFYDPANLFYIAPGSRVLMYAPDNTINLQAILPASLAGASILWRKTGGADQVVFTDVASTNTSVIMGFAGTYVLTATATLGAVTATAQITLTLLPEIAGTFQNIADFLSGPLSTNGTSFLTRYPSTSTDATNYYAQTPNGSYSSTLTNLLGAWGFQLDMNTMPGATNYYDSNAYISVSTACYENALDLGFGRRMLLINYGGGYYLFAVSNYRTVEDAIKGGPPIATVCMEYYGGGYTMFSVYASNGNRVNSADLDGGGAKFVPGLCVDCHGGTTGTIGSTFPGNLGAHFLPFDLRGLDFSTRPGFTRAEQEPVFKLMNQAVLDIENEIRTNEPASFSPAITNLITGWYGPGLTNATANDAYVPKAWQDTNATSALNLAGQAYLYLNVVAPSCRSCHQTRIPSHSLDFASFTNFNTVAGNPRTTGLIKSEVFGSADITVNPVVMYQNNTTIVMPHARRTFQRFWNSTSPRPEPNILRAYLLNQLFSLVPFPGAAKLSSYSGNDVLFSFPTALGQSYTVERTDDLAHPNWTPLGGVISGTGGTVQLIEPLPAGQSQGFYRLNEALP